MFIMPGVQFAIYKIREIGMKKEEETLLVERARTGDEIAFKKLVSPLRDRIYWRALKAMKDPDEADDIVQESIIRAYTRLETFRGESRFSTWLYTVASNCIRMRLRTIKRKGALKIEDNQAEVEKSIADNSNYIPALPDKACMQAQMFEDIEKAICELPEKYAQIIRMWAYEGMNLREINNADKDSSIPAIKTRLHRARKKLKNALEPSYGKSLLSA
tara:strand:+ start:1182 stop:1832 length:651 start_codon:yes stop_codon:yes gene_type:complete